MNKVNRSTRVGLIDEIRGLAIILMVIYHAAYDLQFLFDVSVPFFMGPMVDTLRNIVAGLFIFIAGISCQYSRSNLKRGIYCLGFALLLTAATYFFMRDQLIVFGVLHLLGSCMILYAFAKKAIDWFHPIAGILTFLILFVFTMGVSKGYVGIPSILEIDLPGALYNTNYLSPLGFYNASFFSSDYYPLLPWMFLFICGSYVGILFKERLFPQAFYHSHVPFLATTGRNTLIIYMLHQPILYGIFYLIFNIILK